MKNTPPRSAALLAQIAARKAQGRDLQTKFQAAIADTANNPAAAEAAAALEPLLAANGAAVRALEMALTVAKEADDQDAKAAGIAATQSTRTRALKNAKARIGTAAAVDEAGAALIKAIEAWRSASTPVAADVREVITARYAFDTNPLDRQMHFAPHAGGTSRAFGAALVAVFKTALETLGAPTSELVEVNPFSTFAGLTFERAAAEAAETLNAL